MKRISAKNTIAGLALITALAGAVAMDGEIGGIAWTSFPVVIAIVPLVFIDKFNRGARYAAYAFSITAITILVFFYVGWAVDLGSMATGSSTSALLFIFIPLYALLATSVVAVVALVVGLVHEFVIQRRPSQAL